VPERSESRPRPPRTGRRSKHRPSRPPRPKSVPTGSVGYLRIEIDLVHEAFFRRSFPLLQRFEEVFREREVVEVEGLLRLVASVLHALAPRGFSRVDHWEARPGGWLPLPEPAHERLTEPVGHLLRALESPSWEIVAEARSFAVRLSGPGSTRADVTVRRVHREHGHAITVELYGPVPPPTLRGIETALRENLAIVRLRVARGATLLGRSTAP